MVLSFPEPKLFTRNQLVERLDWDLEEIALFMKQGVLKQCFDTFKSGNSHLRKLRYYECDMGEELQLDAFVSGSPLNEVVDSIKQDGIIDCPKYLYIPSADNATLDYVEKTTFRYFLNIDNYPLIPVEEDGHHIIFPSIEKNYDLFVSIEEVERFERDEEEYLLREILEEFGPEIDKAIEEELEREEKQNESSSEKKVKLIPLATIDTPSINTTDNTFEDKSTITENLLRMPEVKKRVNFSESHIYRMISEGKFPAPTKPTGGRGNAWIESEIDAWIEEGKNKREEGQ